MTCLLYVHGCGITLITPSMAEHDQTRRREIEKDSVFCRHRVRKWILLGNYILETLLHERTTRPNPIKRLLIVNVLICEELSRLVL